MCTDIRVYSIFVGDILLVQRTLADGSGTRTARHRRSIRDRTFNGTYATSVPVCSLFMKNLVVPVLVLSMDYTVVSV